MLSHKNEKQVLTFSTDLELLQCQPSRPPATRGPISLLYRFTAPSVIPRSAMQVLIKPKCDCCHLLELWKTLVSEERPVRDLGVQSDPFVDKEYGPHLLASSLPDQLGWLAMAEEYQFYLRKSWGRHASTPAKATLSKIKIIILQHLEQVLITSCTSLSVISVGANPAKHKCIPYIWELQLPSI